MEIVALVGIVLVGSILEAAFAASLDLFIDRVANYLNRKKNATTVDVNERKNCESLEINIFD